MPRLLASCVWLLCWLSIEQYFPETSAGQKSNDNLTSVDLSWSPKFGLIIGCVMEDKLYAYQYCLCQREPCMTLSAPNSSFCRHEQVSSTVFHGLAVLFQMSLNESTVMVASQELASLTQNISSFFHVDVTLTARILENIVNFTTRLNETGVSIFKTVDNLLNVNPDVLAQSHIQAETINRVITSLEKYLSYTNIDDGGKLHYGGNIIAFSTNIDVNTFKGMGAALIGNKSASTDQESSFYASYDDKEFLNISSVVSVTLPGSLFKNLEFNACNEEKRVFVIIYKNALFFQVLTRIASNTSGHSGVRKRNSYVIAAGVMGTKVENLTDPLVTRFSSLKRGRENSTACVFWDFTLRDYHGGWSSVGCSYQGTTLGMVTCYCNHLTNFAILMDVNINDFDKNKPKNETQEKVLSIISYIGCMVSLLGLILTTIINLVILTKDPKSSSSVYTKTLLNFCFSLALTLVVFLTAAERSKTSSVASCRAAAIALHYFAMVVFFWMAIEAFSMYMSFVKLLQKQKSYYKLKFCFAWGMPAAIVTLTAVLDFDSYGGQKYCRLHGLPFLVAFLAPVSFILLGNFITYILILRSLVTSGSSLTVHGRRNSTRLVQARRGVSILVVLGLTWFFGILAIQDARLIFQYLFCIFNSLQGFLVFVFYCVLSSEARQKFKTFPCWKKRDIVSNTEQFGQTPHFTPTVSHILPCDVSPQPGARGPSFPRPAK